MLTFQDLNCTYIKFLSFSSGMQVPINTEMLKKKKEEEEEERKEKKKKL